MPARENVIELLRIVEVLAHQVRSASAMYLGEYPRYKHMVAKDIQNALGMCVLPEKKVIQVQFCELQLPVWRTNAAGIGLTTAQVDAFKTLSTADHAQAGEAPA